MEAWISMPVNVQISPQVRQNRHILRALEGEANPFPKLGSASFPLLLSALASLDLS